jgi:hypothetical protein
MAAAYAEGGTGKFKNEILWLTWGGGTLGTPNVTIKNGDETEASIQVTVDTQLKVSCRISDITNGKSGNVLKSYRPGAWSGDTLDDAYFVGAPGSSNRLISGIVAQVGPDNFKVTCNSSLVTGGASIPANLRGFVIADAESMAPNEYILGASRGKWSVIENLGLSKSAYFVDKRTPTAPVQLIGQSGDSYIKLLTKEGDGGRGVVTFLQFAQSSSTQSMNFQIKGNGNTAIAIGLLVPFADFGDAPTDYGAAMHLIADVNFSDDGVGSTGEVNVLSSALTQSPSVLRPPRTVYLGSIGPDAEPSSAFSSDGKGDDQGGQSALLGSLLISTQN